jgi:hypothetical protein
MISAFCRFAATALVGLTLAACQSVGSGGAALTPPPLPSSAGTPPPLQRTSVTERTTLSSDGSTLRTTRTTTSVGFDPERAASAAGRLMSGMGGGVNQGIPGQWTSQSASTGTGCTIALYGAPEATSGGAASACNAGSVLAGINGWSYQNGQLSLMRGSEAALTLSQLGPNRFDGTATWGFLSTRISLYR